MRHYNASRSRPFALCVAVLFLLLAAAMLVMGVKLATLGGSYYYAVAGGVLALIALLLLARQPSAVNVFAFFLVGSTAWAWWEVGFDFWQILPRLWVWLALGVLLVLPWVTRTLGKPRDQTRRRRTRTGTLWLAIAITMAVGAWAFIAPVADRVGTASMDARNAVAGDPAMASGDWPGYGGSAKGDRYSPLTQINAANIGALKEAWRIETGDTKGPDDPSETTNENTPIKIGDTVYLCTPHSWVIAVDASTGAEKWRFNPQLQSPVGFSHWEHMTCRGVSYHDDAAYPAVVDAAPVSGATAMAPAASGTVAAASLPAPAAPGATATSVVAPQPCPRRIFLPTADARLIALDADTGKPCDDFGVHGTIDLRQNIGPFVPGGYYSTSPPAITRDLVIIGGHVTDNGSTDEPSGVVRAFDVHDGHLVWNFDAGNPADTAPIAPGKTYVRNSPNMWSMFGVDEKLGLVYLPMGNQTPDQYAALRTPESEKLSAGIVALDIATGALKWNYQFTHHDLWDMDIGGQPSLVDIQTSAGLVPSLVASTKQGSIYVLDRRDGKPVYAITERPVPQGAVEGDHTSPTQPVSAINFIPAPMREADMWGTTPLDQLWCRMTFRSQRYDGAFTPPSTRGSLVFPGNFGVFDWGGVSIDPVRQLMFLNPSYMAFQSRLIPNAELYKEERGMPASEMNGLKEPKGIPYAIELKPFLSLLGIPCQAPPWGYVAAVDLTTGKTIYQHRNGTIRDSAPLPIPLPLGVPSLGGTVITAGGVAFLSGTLDNYIRGYDVQSGRQLWQARLPAGGQATPMSYADRNGRQFILVVAGGHGSLGTKMGDYVIAYALPDGAATH
jgi:quinoprotein glucose dehydrogenase